MKHLHLLLALAVASPTCVVAQPQVQPSSENQARADFSRRMSALNDKGDWQGLLENGLDWQMQHPSDPNGWWTQAWGAFNLGDLDTASSAWQRGDGMEHANEKNPLLETAQKVRAQYPTLKFKPLEFVEGDAVQAQHEWEAKGAALLAAKKYDEIEKTALELQKSNASNSKGSPHLGFFFDGLCGAKDPLTKRQSRVAAWRTARPQSDLARLTSVQLWVDEAWNVRGTGTADTITEEASAKMGTYLQKAFANLKTWPDSAFKSPLAFIVALGWGQLAGAPSEFSEPLFTRGMEQFPKYLPLYRTRALFLMPRWFGQPGDLEKFVTEQADKIGGTEGDILYAQLVWAQMQNHGDIWKETDFSYDRFKKGMQALTQRNPDSVSVANTLMRGATLRGDDETIKEFFASANGHLIDSSWWSEKQRVSLPAMRMNYLAK